MKQELGAYIQACSRRVFGWGIWDCCLFAADAVHCTTGRDPAAHLRAIYANEDEASALVERIGGFDQILINAGLQPTVPPYRDGDVGILKTRTPIAAMVVYWQGRFLGADLHGLRQISAQHISTVFRLCSPTSISTPLP